MTTRTANTIKTVYTSSPARSARRSTPDKQAGHSMSDTKNTPVITNKGQKSNFAKHLLEEQHALHPMEDCMSIVHTVKQEPMMNTIEKFHIYKETMNNNHLNDRSTVTHNAIFEKLLRNSNK